MEREGLPAASLLGLPRGALPDDGEERKERGGGEGEGKAPPNS